MLRGAQHASAPGICLYLCHAMTRGKLIVVSITGEIALSAHSLGVFVSWELPSAGGRPLPQK
jgi:hypothetical protein